MCPQALDKDQYSFLSEIWSLGILYYELLFGFTPWKDDNEKVLSYKISNIPLEFPSHTIISEQSKDFITKCL